ncbi:MAG: hypothetical protein FWF34_03175 [Alphaproteobacteria bacterium]|nr:hypothetical protein [Alphaproteobacteria bacterium]
MAGPTASGKSGFAHALAKQIGGVIINCDSVQMYRGIEIISASPFADNSCLPLIEGECHAKRDEGELPPVASGDSPPQKGGHKSFCEINNVPYHLFSVLPLNQQISVGEYLDMARDVYNTAIRSGTPVIFVGGTGFYINAILNGISAMPAVSDVNRKRARDMVRDDIDAVRELLGPGAPSDPQRAARALEILFETGRPITEWQSEPRTGAIVPDAIKFLINPPREILAARIPARIPGMIAAGAIDEARKMTDPSRAIGGAEIMQFVRGEIDEPTMIANWTIKTNQYAKRQRTWFKHQFSADIIIGNIPGAADLENAKNMI